VKLTTAVAQTNESASISEFVHVTKVQAGAVFDFLSLEEQH